MPFATNRRKAQEKNFKRLRASCSGGLWPPIVFTRDPLHRPSAPETAPATTKHARLRVARRIPDFDPPRFRRASPYQRSSDAGDR